MTRDRNVSKVVMKGVLNDGFTLIEMLVSILILTILLLLAIPSFSVLISNNKMISEVYVMRSTINHARTEALARRAPIVICPTTDGLACANSNDWSTGYMTFVDTDDNNIADPSDPDEEIIQWESRQRSVSIIFDNVNKRVRYGTQGFAQDHGGTFTFCDERGSTDARALILNPAGSLRAAIDADLSCE